MNKLFAPLAGACRSAWPGCCHCWLMGIQLWKWHVTYCVLEQQTEKHIYLHSNQCLATVFICCRNMFAKKNRSLAYWFDNLDQSLVLSFEVLYQEKKSKSSLFIFFWSMFLVLLCIIHQGNSCLCNILSKCNYVLCLWNYFPFQMTRNHFYFSVTFFNHLALFWYMTTTVYLVEYPGSCWNISHCWK